MTTRSPVRNVVNQIREGEAPAEPLSRCGPDPSLVTERKQEELLNTNLR